MKARLHRIGIGVHDLDKAVETYSKLLDTEFHLTGEQVAQEVGLRVAASWECGVELLQPLEGSSNPLAQQIAEAIRTRGEGIIGCGFRTDDFKAAQDCAKSAGVGVLIPHFAFTPEQLKNEFAGAYTTFEEEVYDSLPGLGFALGFNTIVDA